MAWLSMLAGLAFPLLILATESATLGQIALPFYTFIGMVVAAYIGFATWDDKNAGFKSDGYNGGGGASTGGYSGVDNERLETERQDRPDGRGL